MDDNQRGSRLGWLSAGVFVAFVLVSGDQCDDTRMAWALLILSLLGAVSAWLGKPKLRPWLYLILPLTSVLFHH